MNVMTLIFITAVLPFAKLCPQGQFKSAYVDGCSDCPEDPETSCQYEGDDAVACENACIEERTERTPSDQPEQSGDNSSEQIGPGSQGPQKTSGSTGKNDVPGRKPNVVTVDPSPPGTNRTSVIVGITCAAIALAIVIGLAVYFLRRYIDQRHPPNPNPTEHEEIEMGGRNEDNQQVLLPRSETPIDLNKVDQQRQQERESTV